MKHIFQLMACLLPFSLFAQTHTTNTSAESKDTGVHFLHNLTWSDVQRKAKAEHKYIFMDCFTTWCGPCKYMSKNVFPQKAVGDVMNDKFIAVKMQLDTSEADNAEVKDLYATAHAIARNYNVNVYPTYLFFSPDGNLVHRAVGSSEADAFLAKAADALNPKMQYYTLLAKYKNGQKDSSFLHHLTDASMDAYDKENESSIANDYLATQPDLYTPGNLAILREATQSSSDKGFDIMRQNPAKVDAVLGAGTADAIVQSIILREDVYPMMFPKNVKSAKDLEEPNWNNINAVLQAKYPAQAASVVAYSKVEFYMQKADWSQFGPAMVDYMKDYGNNLSNDQLNQFAWTVFQNCNDETCLQNALAWSKRSFDKNNTPGFMDTYANILYRMGKKDEALDWEQKAKDAAADGDKSGYQQVIDKMKAGEKTWN